MDMPCTLRERILAQAMRSKPQMGMAIQDILEREEILLRRNSPQCYGRIQELQIQGDLQMSLLDKYFIEDSFKENCLRYLFTLQSIALYKFDTDDYSTPYQFEQSRKIAHDRLFQENILPTLKLEEGFSEYDAYNRSKEIFSNLDRVWKIYDETEFDLTKDDTIPWLVLYLWKLLRSTEGEYYLEGHTQYIHGINI
jgi:hypothetical protein